MAIDPVCGMDVDPATARFQFEHEAQVYYFCAPGCKKTFATDPMHYLNPAYAPSMETETEASFSTLTADLTTADEENLARRGLEFGLKKWFEACPCCFQEEYPKGLLEAMTKLGG